MPSGPIPAGRVDEVVEWNGLRDAPVDRVFPFGGDGASFDVIVCEVDRERTSLLKHSHIDLVIFELGVVRHSEAEISPTVA